ncbi:MAG TPA: OmpA family protein [Bacteroidales bacterium]|nr:OmpA family protein [Bacteroidales bacterium]HNX08207.1 OmpA family protein [Bacteroidales bacterium]HPI30999.1 OmpA family protein [Bacteroidales bacterium]
MKKLLIICVIFLGMAYISNAQTADRKWSIGLHGGLTQYSGDLGQSFYMANKGAYGFGGLSFSRYLNRFLDISLMGNYGTVGYKEKESDEFFSGNMIHTNINIRLKFLGNDKYKLSPYIFAGAGFTHFNKIKNNTTDNYVKKETLKFNNAARPVCGVGLTWHMGDVVSLQLQEMFIFSDYDRVDGQVGWERYNDNYLQHSLGILFKFGKAKDTDKDGIADKDDKCPTVPGLAQFQGCPDTDKDGVIDGDDKCPGTPEGVKVDAKGCPLDTDGDGVVDYLDKCPDVKGLAKFEGCPDSDGDGVIDNDDQCPNTPERVKVDEKGCPLDRDGDGIPDYQDKCPDVKGLPAYEGCPDRDGDGIPDNVDKCPDVKGIAANKGCPEVKEEVKKVFNQALQGIKFETGKDVIRPVSFPILDNVVKIMKENKEYNLIINGHTDNVGSDESNKILSDKRATAVKNYLINKGVEAGRLKSFGWGEEKPTADNNTAAGRTLNRRVEFIVEF